jgi:hypothetical protein
MSDLRTKYDSYSQQQLELIYKNKALSQDKKEVIETIMIEKGFLAPEEAQYTEGVQPIPQEAPVKKASKAAAAKPAKEPKAAKEPKPAKEPKVPKEKKVREMGSDLKKPFYYKVGQKIKFIPAGNSKLPKVETEGEIISTFVFNETANKCYNIRVDHADGQTSVVIKRQVSLLELNPVDTAKLDAAFLKINTPQTWDEFLQSQVKKEKEPIVKEAKVKGKPVVADEDDEDEEDEAPKAKKSSAKKPAVTEDDDDETGEEE